MSKKLIILSILCCCIPSRSQAGDVSLAWDHSTSSDIVAYRMYFGTSSGSYTFQKWTGRTTSIVVNGLPNGTWFFVVIAINSSGERSGFSNEVSTAVSGNAPALPSIPRKVSRLRFGSVLSVSRETLNVEINLQLVKKSSIPPDPPRF